MSSGGNATGAYGLFAHVDPVNGVALTKNVRFQLDGLKITNDFDFNVGDEQNGSFLSLTQLSKYDIFIIYFFIFYFLISKMWF